MKHHLVRSLVPRSIRNWLRSPAKSLHYVTDRVAYAIGASPTISPADGWYLRCHPAARHHFEVFRSDPSQAEELRAFAAHCRPGMNLLDVGAHFGFFALACLHFAKSDAKVLCVEASPKAADILRANLALNGANARVSVRSCAMGTADGELQMLATGPIGADYFLVPTEQRSDTIRVPQQTLESLLKATGFQPTHIKMDIEGFEYDVIAGALECLKEHRPILFLELHGTYIRQMGHDPADIMRVLRECGYQRFEMDGRPVTDAELAAHNFDCRIVTRFA